MNSDKVVPTRDELVDERVEVISRDPYWLNRYVWKSGWGAILLRWFSIASKSLAIGVLSGGITVLLAYLLFMTFQVYYLPWEICHFYLSYFAPMLLLTFASGGGALAAGNFLEGKAKDHALMFAANEREQELLTGGNYFREIEDRATNRLSWAVFLELQPFRNRETALEADLAVYEQSLVTANDLEKTPTQKLLVKRISDKIASTKEELGQIKTKIKETYEEMRRLQSRIKEIAAHAPLLDVEHSRMLCEDKDLLNADIDRQMSLEEISEEIETALSTVQIESGIDVPQIDQCKRLQIKE